MAITKKDVINSIYNILAGLSIVIGLVIGLPSYLFLSKTIIAEIKALIFIAVSLLWAIFFLLAKAIYNTKK